MIFAKYKNLICSFLPYLNISQVDLIFQSKIWSNHIKISLITRNLIKRFQLCEIMLEVVRCVCLTYGETLLLLEVLSDS